MEQFPDFGLKGDLQEFPAPKHNNVRLIEFVTEEHSTKPQYVRPPQSRIKRLGKALREPINRWLARYSLIPDKPLVDATSIDGLDEVSRNWRVIQDELDTLLVEREKIPDFASISPDHRRIAPSSHWKSFFFTGYGYHSESNCNLCPRTWELLQQVPGLVVAFFSIMEPGTEVPRHRGLTKGWLNCHLGLLVPAGSELCGMEVADQVVGWQKGEWLVFDDTNPHRVWNRAETSRCVLFLQVKRPMRWPGRAATELIYQLVRRSSFVQDIRHKIDANN